MLNKKRAPYFRLIRCFLILVALSICSSFSTVHAEGVRASGLPVKKAERRPVVSTEYGEISAVQISDGINGSYLLHFFTLEPDSLFLPVILNADMVFYVHTGRGKLSWAEEDEFNHMDLRRGDVYRLLRGTLFFMHCDSEAETEQQRLRIHAVFANSNDDLREPATGPYSSIQDMVLGFDKKLLQATFKVSEEVIDELLDGTKPPAIIHVDPAWEMEDQFTRGLLESRSYDIFELNKKKKRKKEHARLFNLYEEDKDFENCNGWITTITRKKLSALKGSGIGLFLVKLTAGSMMEPHWNSEAADIVVVLEGRGMMRVVCSSISKEKEVCRNMRFEVEEGDVFAVPRFHVMAQMAFNNGTFVYLGFSTITERNQPQFLAGQGSILRTLDKDVLAVSFNITNTTVDELLAPREESVFLDCTSCAEEELRIMDEEKEEEAGQREEEGETEEEAGQREEEGETEEEAGEREEEGEREEAPGREQGGEKERQQEEESETEEEEQGGNSGGGGGGSSKGEPLRTELQHENNDVHGEWGRRIAKNKKRLTV